MPQKGIWNACRTSFNISLIMTLSGYVLSLEPSQMSKTPVHMSNVTSLLLQYLSICGYDFFCDKTLLPFLDTSNTTYEHLALCPQCFCDSKCLVRGDCCADIFFSIPPLSCREVLILMDEERSAINDVPKYIVVDSCPDNSDAFLQDKCSGNVSIAKRLPLTPVTSRENIPVTYFNQYCAECNGVSNYSIWNLDIDCLDFADFNFLSSYEEIIDLAKEKMCIITFDNSDNPVPQCKPLKTNIVSTSNEYEWCNITGTWVDYDPDVKLACESYYQIPFKLFKNVFCSICNPPKRTNQPIRSTCNQTGMWRPYNQGLERACSIFPQSPSTIPYKNIFCYLCNRDIEYESMFVDVEAMLNAKESVSLSKFYYNFDIFDLDVNYFLVVLERHYRKMDSMPHISKEINLYDLTYPNTIFSSGKFNINMTNLLLKSIATNRRGVCNPDILPPMMRNVTTDYCICEPWCADNCCTDFALIFPFACVSSNLTELKGNKGSELVRVVDGCYVPDGLDVFKMMCSFNTSTADIYQLLPVTANGISYKNTYCFLCNNNITEEENLIKSSFSDIIPWEIEIRCDSYLNYDYYLLLHDLTEAAIHMSCEVNILHDDVVEVNYCDELQYPGLVDKCNVTGVWYKEDPDVLWACEKKEHFRIPEYLTDDFTYKNEFCAICNPRIVNSSFVTECNTTGNWPYYDSSVAFACHNLPKVYVHYPYKNVYCKQCNVQYLYTASESGLSGSSGTSSEGDQGGSVDIPVYLNDGFRNLFALTLFDFNENEHASNDCNKNQLFDDLEGVCRNLTCYPGKVLNDSDCTPLLPLTSKLRYIMAVKVSSVLSDNMHIMEYLDTLRKIIPKSLKKFLKVQSINTEVMHLLANQPCKYSNISTYNVSTDVLLYFRFFLSEMVSRLYTEERLISFMSTQQNITGNFREKINIQIHASTTAMMTPEMIFSPEKKFENNCSLSDFRLFVASLQDMYKPVHVANLLLCPQVEFDVHEYETEFGGNGLKLIRYDLSLRFGEFQIMLDGTARVCLDRVSQYIRVSKQNEDIMTTMTNLDIVTCVCLIISLICLLLTFLTYCLFRSLRTIPGKNNMCLMISLFSAQLCLLLQGRVTPKTTPCVIAGVFVHYFWLCAFGCLSVCSFHMYRIFSGRFKIVNTRSGVNKVVLKLAIFSFGTPIVVIFTNISISYALEDDPGYGGLNCFITNRTEFIVTFLVPFMLMCLLNIFFFAYTSYKIKTTPKVKKNKTEKYKFFVYLKLFVVTGSTWIVQLLDSFLPLSFLSYIAAILNGLQGLFLFLSFVCNKRVLKMYRCRVENRPQRKSSS